MANALPKPPFTVGVIERNGLFSRAWSGWIRELYEKVGGSAALSLPEIQASADALSIQIENLNAHVAKLQEEIGDGSGDGLGEGPEL